GGSGFRRSLAARLPCGETVFDAAHRFVEALLVERLEKIVNGLDIERTHGELLVGRDEDHERARSLVNPFEHGEAVKLRHLLVEEHQVRCVLGHGVEGFVTVATLAYDLNVRVCRKQSSNL